MLTVTTKFERHAGKSTREKMIERRYRLLVSFCGTQDEKLVRIGCQRINEPFDLGGIHALAVALTDRYAR